ncbi:Na+/H+ antiporter subunit E [Pseudonocardia sp. H11422]|uniref:Na+/H+ antiporter subunit E n=1 Tax=Pseudonocardia sp. H11422 TaxID=2835866 RepID=UPI001BDBB397|nr:Na+/H+ antiporter subunit E [Pseudonocardia sp. H11422]
MTAPLLHVAALTSVYLLTLTSLHPGDVITGLAVSALLVAAGRRVRPVGPPPNIPLADRLAGVPALVAGTLVDIARGAWDVAGYCLGLRPPTPGIVTIPITPCVPSSAAAWGIRVGLAPDTVVVEVDNEQGRLLLHVLDARDADAVRAAQRDSYERRQRRVFP